MTTMRRTTTRPRYADVVATLALVIAVSGSTYAVAGEVITEPRDSVNTDAIQDHAVTTAKLAPEAVTGAQLGPNAVSGGKVADHSLSLLDSSGTNATQKISFTLHPRSCKQLTLKLAGAVPGSTAVLSLVKGSALPTSVVIGPLAITSPTVARASACSFAKKKVDVKDVAVRVTTLN